MTFAELFWGCTCYPGWWTVAQGVGVSVFTSCIWLVMTRRRAR